MGAVGTLLAFFGARHWIAKLCSGSTTSQIALHVAARVMRAGSGKFEWSRTVVTASSPLMVSEDGREAVAAVVGLQMEYRKFYEFFVNATRVCPRDFASSSSSTAAAACNLTCASPVIMITSN